MAPYVVFSCHKDNCIQQHIVNYTKGMSKERCQSFRRIYKRPIKNRCEEHDEGKCKKSRCQKVHDDNEYSMVDYFCELFNYGKCAREKCIFVHNVNAAVVVR